MSDKEEDYMSDKFLDGLQDVRPSLINNRSKKREIVVEAKQKEHIKRQKQTSSATVNNESLQAALSIPLAQENKGYKLLAKMGYKPGQALGKPETDEKTSGKDSRLVEPIGITIKTDRQGLGRAAALQELNDMRRKIRRQRYEKELGGETSIEDFRRRTNQKHEDKFILNSLRRCQVTCENLDIKSNVQEPELPWFWPERTKEAEEDNNKNDTDDEDKSNDELEEEFSSQEKLEMLTNYVRTSYLFCYWCGVHYNDEQDLKDNCPGLTKDDH